GRRGCLAARAVGVAGLAARAGARARTDAARARDRRLARPQPSATRRDPPRLPLRRACARADRAVAVSLSVPRAAGTAARLRAPFAAAGALCRERLRGAAVRRAH